MESWVRTISVGSGVSGILPSLKYQVPVAIAWLALSSALLITLLPRGRFSRGVGAYLVASVATFVKGITGTFERIVDKLPVGISAAMLAGILLGFAAK
ncbi:benzoate/H(+) symporter BenE family transporter [Agrobacterium tumefaciens]|uniref:benzoate/H(+) symporter BenE family transporter n=1 Tax=Agrobacterium tumefaciens TaxID=358 RepID=UPI00234FD983|nr:benzoate/H(+) symporter BenE family transporter [Agrobacterium tumefaciens]